MHYHTEVDDFPIAAHSEMVYSSHSDLNDYDFSRFPKFWQFWDVSPQNLCLQVVQLLKNEILFDWIF